MTAPMAFAETIGVDALRALRPGTGEIAAVFRRSLYIRSGSDWMCVGRPEIGAGPLNVLVDLRCDWRTLVVSGQPVMATGDGLRIGPLPIGLAGAKIWAPPALPRWTLRSLADGLAHLEHLLDLYPPPPNGLGCYACPDPAPVSLEARGAATSVAALARWLGEGTGAPDVLPLLGLGPGLTPSGDDYLSGTMATLHAIGRPGERNRLWSMIAPVRTSMTSAISAAHLACAAEGRLAEQQHIVLNAILSCDQAALGVAIEALAGQAHTSPWDSLAGMVSVLRMTVECEAKSCKGARQLHTTQGDDLVPSLN